jgi:hypothetical protein
MRSRLEEHGSSRARRQIAVAVLALAIAALAAAAPARAGAGTGDEDAAASASQPGAIDAVVGEVVKMLEAKVSERVIVHWLETSGQRPAAIGSREIVELKRAGASDALMDKLLDLAARKPAPDLRGTPAQAEAPAGQPGGQPAPASPSREAAPAAPAAAAAPPASAPSSTTGTAPSQPYARPAAGLPDADRAANLHWSIAYHPNFGADDERWDLYVYLDGRYLAWVKSPLVSFVDPPLEFDRSLPPGRHVLLVAEERHLRKLGRSGWTHEARVAPAPLAFEIAPGAAGRVELRCETRVGGGPISLRVTQGDAEVAKATPAIGQPDAWPALCDEANAARRAGKGPAAPARREPSSCLRWADLWTGVPAAPSRDAVRADLERRGFRPDPARSGE